MIYIGSAQLFACMSVIAIFFITGAASALVFKSMNNAVYQLKCEDQKPSAANGDKDEMKLIDLENPDEHVKDESEAGDVEKAKGGAGDAGADAVL